MPDEAKEVLDEARKLNISFNHIKHVADRLAKKGVLLQSSHISSDNLVSQLMVMEVITLKKNVNSTCLLYLSTKKCVEHIFIKTSYQDEK